jgi:integrase
MNEPDERAVTMAKVRKRTWTNKSGEQTAWIADYFSPGKDGKPERHIKTFATKKAASAWLVTAQGEVARGVHTPASASITVAAAGDAWLLAAEADELEASTIRQYQQHLKLHIKPFLGTVKLSELTTASVKNFRRNLLTGGRSQAMVKKVVSSLGSILVDANVARNVVHDEALQGHKRRRSGVEKRAKRRLEPGRDFPTKLEMLGILEAAAKLPGKWHAMLLTAAFTGLRASELRGLTWGDVNTDTKILTVRQRADRWNTIGAPKSESSQRDVPLAGGVIVALEQWRKVCPEGADDLVFPNRVGKVETLPTIHRRGLGPIQVAAGISTARVRPKYGMHSFRHFAASLFCERLPPKKVQALMGHSTIAMTLDVYTHLFPSPEGDAAVMSQIEQAFLPAA